MLDNLGPGDLITAEIVVDNNQGVITKITKIGTAKPDTPSPAGAAKPGVRYLSPRRSGAESGVRRSGRARGGLQQHSRQPGDGSDVHLHEVPDADVLSDDGSAVRRSAEADQRARASTERPPCCR